MERIYNTYLKIIKNICTSSDHSVSVHPEDLAALAKLAQEHCTVPFVLPYLRSASVPLSCLLFEAHLFTLPCSSGHAA